MDGLETLAAEHRTLRRFVEALSDLLDDHDFVSLRRDDLRDAAAFLELFVVGFHDRREEEVLLPFLAERGRASGADGVIRFHEHDETSSHSRRMRDSESVDAAVWSARITLRALALHLEDEEAKLYPSLRRELLASERAELERRLSRAFPDRGEILAAAAELLHRIELASGRSLGAA